ncbi:MAG: hypothetical protein E6H63_00165 [Betaproteobacteria bacterium]|nr:MAG: hypothetical protein E6H63_00165 [Betaproteobacteria bacterium]TMH47169.1 MAG: hypothetical protein E6H54_00560 [Betaproteobacteria bacterium]
MEIVVAIIEIVRRLARGMGPYLLVEILLPGGSLLALALFLYRRRESFLNAVSISLPAKRL